MLSVSVNPFLAAVSWISFEKHLTLRRFQGLCNFHSTKSYLCVVQGIKRTTLLVNFFDRSGELLVPRGFRGEVLIKNRDAAVLNVAFGQRINHEHNPYWPLLLPVFSQKLKYLVGVRRHALTVTTIIVAQPNRYHFFDVSKVAIKASVHPPRYHVLKKSSLG